jgi:hypothetical protein
MVVAMIAIGDHMMLQGNARGWSDEQTVARNVHISFPNGRQGDSNAILMNQPKSYFGFFQYPETVQNDRNFAPKYPKSI